MTKRIYTKRNSQIYTVIICACILVLSAVLVLHKLGETAPAIPTNVVKETKPAAGTPVVNRGLPSKLVIPKLKVDAKIGYMGMTDDGAMQVPTNIHDVGWYKYGALPGNKGSSVIAGHLDGLRGEAGVFAKLDTLQKGDSFSVIDSKNQSTSFVVREIKSYSHDAQPDEVFKAADGAHLNLITCTGAWDKNKKQFTERLVVFADQATI